MRRGRELPPLDHPVRSSREPILVEDNPETDARQDGEAVAAIAYCEFQHGTFLLSRFLEWRMKESALARNGYRSNKTALASRP